jgi:hypothetical protein
VGAGGPHAVEANLAVDGAFVGVALLLVGELRALLATELRVVLDGTLTVLEASAARGSASTEGAELGNLAVNSAGVGVAGERLGGTAGALLAAVGSLGEGLAGAGLDALAAGLGAGRPLGPLAHLAVGRALHEEATDSLVLDDSHVVDVLLGGRALLAAELGSHDDTFVARLEASATGLGALGELAVVRDDAIDRAGMSHALRLFLNVRADTAAVLGLGDNLAGTLLGASSTGLGAS